MYVLVVVYKGNIFCIQSKYYFFWNRKQQLSWSLSIYNSVKQCYEILEDQSSGRNYHNDWTRQELRTKINLTHYTALDFSDWSQATLLFCLLYRYIFHSTLWVHFPFFLFLFFINNIMQKQKYLNCSICVLSTKRYINTLGVFFWNLFLLWKALGLAH